MKIKGMFLIPVIAIIIAMFTLGVVPGMASDTTAADTTISDTLTYIAPTYPPTSSFDEKIEGFISEAFGEDLKDAEEPVRGFTRLMDDFLDSFRRILDALIRMLQAGGGIVGNTNIENLFGTLF